MPRKPSYDRNKLIEQARDLFWTRGWAGTSLKDLEAALKMKPGSFYAAFGSKENLFDLALQKYASDGRMRLQLLSDHHGPLGALQRLPLLVISSDDAPAKACMLSKTLLELQAHGHPLAERASDLLLEMEAQFCALFEQAQTQQLISTARKPQDLARRFQSDLLGLRISAERNGINATLIAEELVRGLASL
ncbi:TetR/AcrR family transcriptional regulator [Amylibacter marinus]|nr:TetR/AcrR family transcriptional regulator [Amylibacter marinus]